MGVFPLERFTTDPQILKYSKSLETVYNSVLYEFEQSFHLFFRDLKEHIMENEHWILHKIQKLGLKDAEILNGLFLKIYDANLATLHWPPLNYPSTAPLLVYVPGYHGESNLEWSMRILRKIGIDMRSGYHPSQFPPAYTPDLTHPLNPYETSWLEDKTIRKAFNAIRAGLTGTKYVLKTLLEKKKSMKSLTDEEILIAYTQEHRIYENTVCSLMNTASRFFANIQGSSDFDTFYARLEKPSKEYDALFMTNNILPEKLTRKGLAWDQQLFTVLGPAINPQTDSFIVLSRDTGGLTSVPYSDTVWIQTEMDPSFSDRSRNTPGIIQGAYMSEFRPFLQLYFNGVRAVSPYLLEMLKDSETSRELGERKALQTLINPYGTLPTQFTLTGKFSRFVTPHPYETFYNVSYKAKSTNFNPLMSNLRRLRKTLKKRQWHFWGPGPSKLVNEFIDRYSVDLTKNQEIRDAATALQMHHTTANKDALIQALKDAIRKYKAAKDMLPLNTYRGVNSKGVYNLGGTNYSSYDASIQELEKEMAKPWYAKTWGKSAKIIQTLLETYLELFSDKGDLTIVNALLALKKLKSQDAIDTLKKAIDIRRYTIRGLPTPGINSEGQAVLKVPLAQVIRNERARLDPNHSPAEIRGQQPWEKSRNKTRKLSSLPAFTDNASNNEITITPPPNADTITIKAPQDGGFSPTIMSSFVANGMSLLPAAGYLAYRQRESRKKTRA
jgi:hypothetical protein